MSSPVARLELASLSVELRRAREEDLPALVALLAKDPLGREREATSTSGDIGPDALGPYRRAFAAIDADPAHLLIAAVSGEEVVGTFQLTFLPGLSRGGALRAQIEAVRVREDLRSQGLGHAMFAWAIDEARRRGCALVQLTTDRSRADAQRFYDRLGFVASHEGYKLTL